VVNVTGSHTPAVLLTTLRLLKNGMTQGSDACPRFADTPLPKTGFGSETDRTQKMGRQQQLSEGRQIQQHKERTKLDQRYISISRLLLSLPGGAGSKLARGTADW
jgi:hypothetical protein